MHLTGDNSISFIGGGDYIVVLILTETFMQLKESSGLERLGFD